MRLRLFLIPLFVVLGAVAVWAQTDPLLSLLAIFQVLQCAFLIFHVNQ